MSTTTQTTPDLVALKADLDKKNATLRRAIRRARDPREFAAERAAAKAAYNAYWGAVDLARGVDPALVASHYGVTA